MGRHATAVHRPRCRSGRQHASRSRTQGAVGGDDGTAWQGLGASLDNNAWPAPRDAVDDRVNAGAVHDGANASLALAGGVVQGGYERLATYPAEFMLPTRGGAAGLREGEALERSAIGRAQLKAREPAGVGADGGINLQAGKRLPRVSLETDAGTGGLGAGGALQDDVRDTLKRQAYGEGEASDATASDDDAILGQRVVEATGQRACAPGPATAANGGAPGVLGREN